MSQVLLFGGRSYYGRPRSRAWTRPGGGVWPGRWWPGRACCRWNMICRGLNDSKKLTAGKRETLYPLIREQAVAWGLGVAWPWEIDEINILQATFRAMGRAVRAMKGEPHFLRIDGDKLIPSYALERDIPQEYVIQGDGKVPAISAASVLAKTFRDHLMVRLARRYPGYGLSKHMGYGTKAHVEAIQKLGPCRLHRLTFKKVKPEGKPQVQGSLF